MKLSSLQSGIEERFREILRLGTASDAHPGANRYGASSRDLNTIQDFSCPKCSVYLKPFFFVLAEMPNFLYCFHNVKTNFKSISEIGT
jgi:hypothetical protein